MRWESGCVSVEVSLSPALAAPLHFSVTQPTRKKADNSKGRSNEFAIPEHMPSSDKDVSKEYKYQRDTNDPQAKEDN